ncbi:unnamed protein product [Owenia fusiformis]|uniref:Uncharacterized protein n=1 Tax=Owenia fusiformis TaxID=6347 RepID=A0A8S4PMF3_OWEFU|nr:unnamed protein product [Owenia fusiformis]
MFLSPLYIMAMEIQRQMKGQRLLILIVLSCLALSNAQIEKAEPFGSTYILSEFEKASCERGNGYTSDIFNCCGFVRCVGNIGIRMHCPFNTVWQPQTCNCVLANHYEVCVISNCTNPLPDFDDSCPDFLDEAGPVRGVKRKLELVKQRLVEIDNDLWFKELWNDRRNPVNGNKLRTYRIHKRHALEPESYVTLTLSKQQRNECCLRTDGFESQIFKGVNETHFMFKNDIQSCPFGQIFYTDTCCCEGPLEAQGAPCTHFTFDRGFNDISDVNGVPTNIRKTQRVSGLPGDMAAVFDQTSKFIIPRFANVEFNFALYICVWVAFDNVQISQHILHNGDEGGLKATISIELVITPDNEKLIVAGVKACDRVQDVVVLLQELLEGQWYHICIAYDDAGEVTLVIDGIRTTVVERERLPEIDLRLVVGSPFWDSLPALRLLDDFEYGHIQARDEINFIVGAAIAFSDPVEEERPLSMLAWLELQDNLANAVIEYFQRPYRHSSNLDDLNIAYDQLGEILRLPRLFEMRISMAKDLVRAEILPFVLESGDRQHIAEVEQLIANLEIGASLVSDVDAILTDIGGYEYHLIDDYMRLAFTLLTANGRNVLSLDAILQIDQLGKRSVDDENHFEKDNNILTEKVLLRLKRASISIPGALTKAPILASKYPIRLGDGFIGAFDEVVICTFVPDLTAQEDLFQNHITPMTRLGDHRDVR